MNPYHKFLIKHRRYCGWGSCMKRATRVIKVNGKDEVRCDAHPSAGPIESGLRLRGKLEYEAR